jgi:hypothetical protein
MESHFATEITVPCLPEVSIESAPFNNSPIVGIF